jgi:hypothetical protein
MIKFYGFISNKNDETPGRNYFNNYDMGGLKNELTFVYLAKARFSYHLTHHILANKVVALL